ncbi:retrovirus-related pol polyprotein from transposon TNT 1-94 [Tanacetum coccineum]
MTEDRSRLRNFMKKFTGIVRFGNNHFSAIMGYGDYVIGGIVISRVYYIEGLGHNLFSVRQFCDSDLEVAFRKHSCYVRDVTVVDLIKGNYGSNLYTISVEYMMKSSPICLLPMRVQTINGKKYILVIDDDYSRFTWVKFLRSKDETPEFVIKFLKQIQVRLNKTVRYIRTDNGTEFNVIVKRVNCTLVEAARTMLIFSKAPMFLWAEAVATTCYTQNRSLIHTSHNKTPYELVHDRKPDLKFLRIFGAFCYLTNDSEDLEKLRPTTDIGIFVGYALNRKGYRIYNKRTRRIMETIHMQFDELTKLMAPMHISTGPAPILLSPGQISSGLVPDPIPAAPYVLPTNKDLEIFFHLMFDEYFEPPSVERPVSPAPAVQVLVVSAGTPLSTIIGQDAPSTSYSPSSSIVQPPISHQVIAAGPTIEDNPFA